MRKQKGFSLIELLIVVAIILIIAAIAIPNLIRAKISANQSSAVASLRSIGTAQIQYQTAYPTVGYAATLLFLGTGAGTLPPTPCPGAASSSACLIDGVMTAAQTIPKSGYIIETTGQVGVGNTTTILDVYESDAGPSTWDRTGDNAYCQVEDGVIRADTTNKKGGAPMAYTYAACQTAPLTPLNN